MCLLVYLSTFDTECETPTRKLLFCATMVLHVDSDANQLRSRYLSAVGDDDDESTVPDGANCAQTLMQCINNHVIVSLCPLNWRSIDGLGLVC